MMTFGVPLQFYFELFLDVSVMVWVNVFAGLNFENFAQIFSSVIAMVVFVIVTVTPIYSYAKIMNSYNVLHTKEFKDRYNPLIEATKIKFNETVNQMWVPIFLFRRYTYAAILCVLQKLPVLQLATCII